MPNGITLADGKYHKLSIVLNSGAEITPDATDPNGLFPTGRKPGFIKWFVDDVEWVRGWTGNQYGYDNTPMTAMRMVVGPWNPDWAGVCLGQDTPCSCQAPCTDSSCNLDVSKCEAALCPAPTYTPWSAVTFNIAQIQYTPLCTDNPNHMYLPINPLHKDEKIYIGPSNRNRWLAESQPAPVLDPTK